VSVLIEETPITALIVRNPSSSLRLRRIKPSQYVLLKVAVLVPTRRSLPVLIRFRIGLTAGEHGLVP
jgi:hypothetical protein